MTTAAAPANTSEAGTSGTIKRKFRVLVAATGTETASLFPKICQEFCEWADVKAIASGESLKFFQTSQVPKNVRIYPYVNSIEMCENDALATWGDVLVIAPMSSNALAKICCGLSEDYVTYMARMWDMTKPVYVAPSMPPSEWEAAVTQHQLSNLKEIGIKNILPVPSKGQNEAFIPGLLCSLVRGLLETEVKVSCDDNKILWPNPYNIVTLKARRPN